MPNASSIPVLLGDQGAELRADDEGLLLCRPREEVRIPLAAVARVRADGRTAVVELTAPAGTAPTSYRIEGVSRAAAGVFEERVNGALPERSGDEEPVDGATLVTVTAVGGANAGRAADEEEDEETVPTAPARIALRCAAVLGGLALLALAVAVVVAGDPVSRAIAVLLVGAPGLALGWLTAVIAATAWDSWYLPRHGITVDVRPAVIKGRVGYGYTATDGRLRATHYGSGDEQVRIAYHPKRPTRVIKCEGPGELAKGLAALIFFGGLTALFVWWATALALPAFR